MGNWEFWRLGERSDADVLARLERLVGSTRQLTAELVAHLGEVEERRLHLITACGSMFQYCTLRLGLSEDEACRRIEVARLARRFPLLFPALARGELSLSVAALLKPYLSDANQVDLVQRLSGKTVRQAEDCLAALFPRPDVASSVRKLANAVPERVALTPGAPSAVGAAVASGVAPSVGNRTAPGSGAGDVATDASSASSDGTPSRVTPDPSCSGIGPEGLSGPAGNTGLTPKPPATPALTSLRRPSRGQFEPLSAERYRVQFTASLTLKEKLELARDLMRHANPTGDFAPIIERALDLLLEQVMQRRFGKTRRGQRDSATVSLTTLPHASPRTSPGYEASSTESTGQPAARAPSRDEASGAPSSQPTAEPTAGDGRAGAPRPPSAPSPGGTNTAASRPSPSGSERITNATRRAVAARDGLQCSWVDDQGRRCPSRAWLEHDHRQPRGKGGSSEAHNIRIFCRAHNQFAAEQAYGREHMRRVVRCGVGTVETPPLTVRDGREPRWLTRHSSTCGRSPSALSRITSGDANGPA